MHKSLTIFRVVFVLVCFLQAEIQVTGTVVTGTIINGYFNRSNSYIQIEIRLTGADAIGDHSNDHVNLRYGSSTSASITIGTDAEDEFTDSADPKLSNNPEYFDDEGSDRVLYYKLRVPDLTHINAAPEGKYFDFEISLSDDAANWLDVDFPGPSPHIIYDRTKPSMTWVTPTGDDTFYFNNNASSEGSTDISFELDETIGIGDSDTPLSNTIKFYGSDDGDLNYTIASDYFTGSSDTPPRHTISDPTGLDLIDGISYTISYRVYDLAGNANRDDEAFANIEYTAVYDITRPTITGISDFKVDSDGGGNWIDLVSNQKVGDGKGKKLKYRIYFSEQVDAGDGTTITYNNSQLSSISEATVDAVEENNGTYFIEVEYIVDGAAHAADPLSITTISSDGVWVDRAGNEIAKTDEAYSIDGGDNLDPIEIDMIAPQISSITSTPLDGKYGLEDVIPLTLVFNDLVILNVDYSLNVFLDAKGATSLEPITSTEILTESGVSQVSLSYTVGENETSIGED